MDKNKEMFVAYCTSEYERGKRLKHGKDIK